MEGGRVNFIPILRRNFIEHPGIHLHKLLAQFKIGNNITEITKQKLLDFKIETKKKMKKCKITVMRKACYKDLMEKYENPMEHACDIEEGQVFITNGWCKPVGMCDSAWESMSPFVMTLAYGGSDIYEGWMKNKNSAMISCNDGFRPVSFYIEVLDEKIYQRGDKKFNINS